MGGFIGSISSWFSGLPSWGKLLIKIGVTVGLDVVASLLEGGRPGTVGNRLKDLQYSSSAYGENITRCRGTVRLPGNVIWGTPMMETEHNSDGNKTFSYRVALAVAFARGPAEKILTIWADGKRMYSSQVTNASKSGTVTSSAAAGSLTVTLNTASASSLTLDSGAIIHFAEDPGVDYQVQDSVILGASSSATVGVWPALNNALAGGGAITIPGLQGATWDTSWFQGVDSNNQPITGSGTFYLGTDAQLPDAVMTKYQGAGNVPGYRDLVFVVFDNLQLVNSGNRIPMFSAEVAFDSTSAAFPVAGPILKTDGTELDLTTPENLSLIIPGSNVSSGIAQQPYVYVYHRDGYPNATLYRINSKTNICEGSIPLPDGQFCEPVIDYEGFVYVHWSDALNHYRIDKFDALTGDFIAGVPNFSPDEFSVGLCNEMHLIDDLQTGAKHLATVGIFDGLKVYDRAYVPPSEWFDLIGLAAELAIGDVWTVVTELASIGSRKVVGIAGLSTSSLVTMGGGAPYPVLASDKYGGVWYGQGTSIVGVDRSVEYDAGTTGIAANIIGLYYNPPDDSITAYDLGPKLTRIDCSTGAVLGTYTPPNNGLMRDAPVAVDALGNILIPCASGPHDWLRINLASIVTGSTPAVTFYNASDYFSPTGSSGDAIYDGNSNSMWIANGNRLRRLYFDRGGAGDVPLADVIAWLCEDAGLASGEYDVSLVTGGIGGVQLERQAVRESLLTLMPLGPLDAAEIDGKLVFVPRGGSSVMTIVEDDLGALDSMDKSERRLSEVLQQEIDTPYRVTLKYYDQGRQYQQAAQDARRISQPYASDLVSGRKVMNSRNELDLTLPVAWTATAAKQAAEKLLYDFWVSRYSYSWKTAIKYLRLDPTDVVELNYKGLTLEARLTQADRGAALALEFAATSSDSGIYTSVAPGSTGAPTPTPTQTPGDFPRPTPAIPGFYVNGS
jgi:putative tail protein